MDILNFRGTNHWLSNFHMAPVKYKGLTFSNSEAAFQAEKCADLLEKLDFVPLGPSDAKALGRSVTLREDWETIKSHVMYEICRAKFEQNPDLMELLLSTDGHLEEGNNHGDTIWGTVQGVGENRLGKILMQLREEFKKVNTKVT